MDHSPKYKSENYKASKRKYIKISESLGDKAKIYQDTKSKNHKINS